MATASRRPTSRPSRPVREAAPRPKNDAYVGLLFISFLALLTSTVLLFLDYNQYGETKPPAVKMAPSGTSGVGIVPGAPADPVAPAGNP